MGTFVVYPLIKTQPLYNHSLTIKTVRPCFIGPEIVSFFFLYQILAFINNTKEIKNVSTVYIKDACPWVMTGKN